MRRWKLCAVAVGLALVALAAFVGRRPPPDPINRDNFHRIRLGMSRAEVVAILGPPGYFTTGPTEGDDDGGGPEEEKRPGESKPAETIEAWQSDRASIGVEYSKAGKVDHTYFASTKPANRSMFDTLRRRVERLLDRILP